MNISNNDAVIVFKESRAKKFLANLIFLIVPRSYALTYVILSLTAFIFKAKNKSFNIENIDIEKLNHLLNISLNDDILIFPSYTYDWIWKEPFLDEYVKTVDNFYIQRGDGFLRVRDVITDMAMLVKYKDEFTHAVIKHLPRPLRFKLKLNNEPGVISFENAMIKNVLTQCQC